MDQNISFSSASIELSGTLQTPVHSKARAVVLLVPGSGQIDRNENSKKFPADIFKQIAADLAEDEIATFRYDKRGVGESGGDYWRTGFFDHVEDASSALKYIQSLAQFRSVPVFILGHSEGAVICARLAANESGIAGAILIAGSAQTGEDTLRWQVVEVSKNMHGLNGALIKLFHIDVVKAQAKALKQIKQSTKDWYRQALIKKVNAKWMREFLSYDPSADLAKIKIPVLAITGSKDIQVNPADLDLMAGMIKGDFECHEIANMTHVLRAEVGEPSIAKYKEELTRPVDSRLLQTIQVWLDALLDRQVRERAKSSAQV